MIRRRCEGTRGRRRGPVALLRQAAPEAAFTQACGRCGRRGNHAPAVPRTRAGSLATLLHRRGTAGRIMFGADRKRQRARASLSHWKMRRRTAGGAAVSGLLLKFSVNQAKNFAAATHRVAGDFADSNDREPAIQRRNSSENATVEPLPSPPRMCHSAPVLEIRCYTAVNNLGLRKGKTIPMPREWCCHPHGHRTLAWRGARRGREVRSGDALQVPDEA